MKVGLQATLTLGFVAALLAVGFVGLSSYRHFRDEQEGIGWAVHTYAVVAELDGAMLLAANAQASVRGYVLSGNEAYLAAHREAMAKLPAALARIRDLTRDNAAQQRRMPELESIATTALQRQREIVQLADLHGLAAARDRINDGGGMELMRQFREVIDAMRTEEQRLAPGRLGSARIEARVAFERTALLVAIVGGLLTLSYILVRHVLAIRLQRETELQAVARSLDERVRERTAQLEAAQHYRAELAAIVESSTDAIISIDPNLNFATWNAGAENLLGYRADEIIGRPFWTVVPEDRQMEMRRVAERIQSGDSIGPYETMRRHKDGRIVPVAATASPIRDANGRVIGASAVLRDISERKRLEAEVSRISDFEQKRLGQDLHDGIGQQLTAIELMLYQAQAEPNAETRGGQLERVSDHLRATIREVRRLARGLAPFILDEGGLQTALAALVTTTKTPTCRLLCPDSLPHLEKDVALQLYRIAQEAFNNALKHSGAGHIDICLEIDEHTVRLEISDDGEGYSDHPRTDPGLGLQIMRYRAELIGADFESRSIPGEGASVICSLPLHA